MWLLQILFTIPRRDDSCSNYFCHSLTDSCKNVVFSKRFILFHFFIYFPKSFVLRYRVFVWTYSYFIIFFTDNVAYSENYINDMIDVLFQNKHMKPVTYAVRASFAINSIRELQYLLETSPVGSTLTVWCSDSKDNVNYPKLIQLINAVGENRVYLDLPDDMSKIFFELYATNGISNTAIGVQSLFLTSIFALKNVFI